MSQAIFYNLNLNSSPQLNAFPSISQQHEDSETILDITYTPKQ